MDCSGSKIDISCLYFSRLYKKGVKMMAKKVPFKVVHASGADDGYSAKELEVHSPTTKGWRSSK